MTTIVGGTWTYSGSPSTDLKDRVRFLIRDTDTTNQLISDEEILWALTDRGSNHYAAAATCCRVIGAQAAGANQVTVGDVSESGGPSGTAQEWMDLADTYDRKATSVGSCPSPFLGGSSIDRRATVAADTDRSRPNFWVGQFDNPSVSLSSTSTSA